MYLPILLSFCFAFGIAQDITAYESAIGSYLASVMQNPTVISALEALATVDPNVIASIQAEPVTAALNSPPNFSALPQPAGSILASIYTAEISIASQYGIIQNGQIVATFSDALPSGFSGSFPSATGSGAAATTSGTVAGSGSAGILSTSQAGLFSSASSSVVALSSNAASSNAPSSSSSKAGAPQATGVAVMGLIAGAVGGMALLL